MRLHGRRELVEIPQGRIIPTRWPWVEKRGDVIHGHQRRKQKGHAKDTIRKGKPQEEENRSNNNVLYGNQSAWSHRIQTQNPLPTKTSLRRFPPKLLYKQDVAPLPMYISFRFSLSGTFQQQPKRRRNSEKTRSMIGSYGVPCHVPKELFSWPTVYRATSEFWLRGTFWLVLLGFASQWEGRVHIIMPEFRYYVDFYFYFYFFGFF